MKSINSLSRNRLLSVLTELCTIIGLIYALFSVRSRELKVYVNPARTILVQHGRSSDLNVLYKGKPISTDVTGIQVGLWNSGKEPIHTEQILEPIVIETDPKVSILEAALHSSTRRVVEPKFDTRALANGILAVSWRILEHDDGMVIQLIVAGPASANLKISGTIEGQKAIQRIYHGAFFNRSLVVTLALLLLLVINIKLFERRSTERPSAERQFVFWAVILLVLASFYAIVIPITAPETPLKFDAPLTNFDIPPEGFP